MFFCVRFTEGIGSGDVDVTAPPPKVAIDGRRKSVFAEAYNPEEDEDDEKMVSRSISEPTLFVRIWFV